MTRSFVAFTAIGLGHLNCGITLYLSLQVRSSGIRCAGMLGHLARKGSSSSESLWQSAWSDIQPSVCTCLLSFLEVADFAPKVKWNTCSAVQRLLQWKAWDEHTMLVERSKSFFFHDGIVFDSIFFCAECISAAFFVPQLQVIHITR
jgi:hypothetical protein